ncbi:MAG: hypothetical protein GY821_06180 [Gammaproteobacteria bacterium]|nr:hypothetical protein [Gammaproteobacteria bacterium]
MKSLVPWPFRQTGRLKICAYCGLRASAFGFPWPAAKDNKKMQWSREGANSILQIRTSRFSNTWEQDWKQVKNEIYVQAA